MTLSFDHHPDAGAALRAHLHAFVRAHRGTTPDAATLSDFMVAADRLYFATQAPGGASDYTPVDTADVVTGHLPDGRSVIAVASSAPAGDPQRLELVKTPGGAWRVQEPPLTRFQSGRIVI